MDYGENKTSDLLQRWKDGDNGALAALLNRHLPWVQRLVHSRLGAGLRRKAETCDFVQDAMVQFLRYGPRIVLQETKQFHGILARIAENTIRDKNDWFKARRRAVSREKPLPSDTVLELDPPRDRKETTPSRAAAANEEEAWIRLGVEFLEPADRELVVLRQWEDRSFIEIGEELGITPNAAEKRYRQAVHRLGDMIGELRRNGVKGFMEKYSA